MIRGRGIHFYFWLYFWAPAVLLAISGGPVVAQARGRVTCTARDNGAAAPASFRVLRGDDAIARGVCGREVEIPPGAYELAVVLDGVLGGPEQRWPVTVRAGEIERVHASFDTGELLVEVRRDGRRSVAQVHLLRDGQELARVSAGVASRVAVGAYALEVEARGESRRIEGLKIVRGERRVVAVDFGGEAK